MPAAGDLGADLGDDPGADAAERVRVAPTPTQAGSDGRGRRRMLVRAGMGLGVIVTVLGAVLVGTNVAVTHAAADVAFEIDDAVPHRSVAIVFGAGLFGAEPSPALQDRIDAAVDLYHRGIVDHVLMTGDNSRPDYDEVTAMRDAAIDAGVPGSAITRDYAGFSTYDSCIRARDVFGVHDAVLVTQDYHVPRALLTCRELGIDAVGVRVPDWQHRPEQLDFAYPTDMARSYMLREWLARTKAVVDVKVTHPDPELGGPFVGLTET